MLMNLLKRRHAIIKKQLDDRTVELAELHKRIVEEEKVVREKARTGYPHGGDLITHNHHVLALFCRENERLKRQASRLRWWIALFE